ncbi:MAG: hypothetical protein HRT47_06545 [Candidatus Caenarcaniphilales bacterium]|nr:hypothetical protein [Candidatus Caenarcaniphilales bacterium]
MFTDYNSIANKIIPKSQQFNKAASLNVDKQVFSNIINNPNHRAQAEKLAAYRASNGEIKPNSQAAEQMKSIQAQLFEVHKKYKSYARKKAAQNEKVFKLLEKIKNIVAAS